MNIKTVSKKIQLGLDPLQIFGAISEQGTKINNALLETAEPGTQKQQKSLVMASAALKITGLDRDLSLEALNTNGKELLKGISQQKKLLEHFAVVELSEDFSLAKFSLKPAASSIDESLRLQELSCLSFIDQLNDLLATNDHDDNVTSLLIGAIGFDAVDQYESLPKVEKTTADFCFFVADQLIIQDKDNYSTKLVAKGFGDNAEQSVHLGLKIEQLLLQLEKYNFNKATDNNAKMVSSKFKIDIDDKTFGERVSSAKHQIEIGDIFQVVLARTFSVDCQDPLLAYKCLRQQNPSPYMYFINFGDEILFGASPESALKIDNERVVSLYPIAGTRKRGYDRNGLLDFETDSRLEFDLLNDDKENAEHMMLLDLARNDLAKIIEAKSRQVTQFRKVVKYSHVMHLVSEVKGALKASFEPMSAYRACANMGTLTGAPKIKAMEIIRQHEKAPRGFYGGAVCVLNAAKEFDSAIIIRSAVVKDGVASITAGAGIVADSQPQLEADETLHKAMSVINACTQATTESENALEEEVA